MILFPPHLKPIRLLLACAALTILDIPSALAQGTAFTYQGRLDERGSPATGSYDLRFGLYNTASGGVQQGSALVGATAVNGGLFTVSLDFGNQFPGVDRWLEIGVRTNGAGAFITLAPRQQIAASPYAITAGNVTGPIPLAQLPPAVVVNGETGLTLDGTFAGNGSALTALNAGNLTSGIVADARLSANVARRDEGNTFRGNQAIDGYLGVGAFPYYPLTFNGTGDKISLYSEAGISIGLGLQNGQFQIHSDRSTTAVTFGHGSSTNMTETMRIQNGNVGIGTDKPAVKLDVAGTARTTVLNVGGSGFLRALKFHVVGDDNEPHVAGFGGPSGMFISLSENGKALGYIGSYSGARDDVDFGTVLGSAASTHLVTDSRPRLTVTAEGNVGIGDQTPATKLTLKSIGYGFEHTDGTRRLSTYLASSGAWFGTRSADPLHFYVSGSAKPNFTLATSGNVGVGNSAPQTKLDVSGEITCVAVNITCDRDAKAKFKAVDHREVLAKVVALPISEWQYKDQPDVRHIGPMAQDFHAAFAVGRDGKHITSVDADGVALAAIQGLNEKLEEKTREVESLRQSVTWLTELVDQLAVRQNGGAR